MLTTKNEKEFLDKLNDVHWVLSKLVLARGVPGSNQLQAEAEIRRFPNVGGYSYGIAEINFMNQRHSGIYSHDPEDIYLQAIDFERMHPHCSWIEVPDCEHTPKVYY